MATADLNKDGWEDVVIGAMDLKSIGLYQQRFSGQQPEPGRSPLLFFDNRMLTKSTNRAH
jgi:hypothetical protein